MLGLFFGFNGRINRVTYWLGNLLVGFLGFFGVMFGFMLAGSQGFDKTTESALRVISTAGLTVGPVMLAMSWASLALQVKRFHDRGRSGLFTLIPLVPAMMIGMTIAGGAATNAPFEQVMGQCALWLNVLFLINIAFFIDLGCLPGKEGPNKYGDPPRGGFGFGAPRPSAPGAPAVPGRAAPAGASGSGLALLGGADAAMQRAISEQAKAKPAPQQATAPRPMVPSAPRPAMAHAPTPGGGFGRKPAR